MSQETGLNNPNIIQNDFEEEPPSAAYRIQITESQKEKLISEANELKKLFDAFEDEWNNPEQENYYVISAHWLRRWKRYTSYDNVTQGQEIDPQWFGQIEPGKINEDITRENPKFLKYPDVEDYRNVFLKEGVQDKRDYELISQATWEALAENYPSIAIRRKAYQLPNGMKAIEVALKQIQIVPICNSNLKDIDHRRSTEFKVYLIQSSSRTPLLDFKIALAQVCSKSQNNLFESSYTYNNSSFNISEETTRLWKLDPTKTFKEFFDEVAKICQNSRTYDYQISFPGTYLEKDKTIPLEEAQIADNDYVILEAQEYQKGWNFYGDGAPILAKCENCNKYGELTVQCACKKVSYCSDECKISDKRFHRSRCERAGDDEEEESKSLALRPDSKQGLVGLQNLGNTCFMNSGLQCLSNTKELTEYFLSDKFMAEINETNPLGTKGKLVKKYGAFLKNLWFGTSGVYSPWALKQGISEFQPMFSGYQQHDSQELLAFLIDGIHEDLNRVKEKPFTETIESENQADYEVAQKSWENHLKRNQSIVVDLFHGQFKSQITCPTCSRVSITFDPFNSVSLPIPIKKEKEIDLFFIFANNKQRAVKITKNFNKTTYTVPQLRQEIAKLINKPLNSFNFVFSTYHSKDNVNIADEDKLMANDLRKKKKFKNLFAFEIPQEDLDADPNERYDVDVHPMKKVKSYYGSDIHKPQSFIRTIHLLKSYTLKQIYIKVFKYFRFLFDDNFPKEDKEKWLALSDEEAFNKIWEEPEEKPFFIHFSTSYSMSDECFFCGERRCRNCMMKCDENVTLRDLLARIKDADYNLELEVVFNDNLPDYVNLEGLSAFEELSKEKMVAEDITKTKGPSIYDCFEQFELPEQLGEENAWYCSKCKDFQKATKKMEVYKAPPILILHFKRFKSGTSFYKKGKITEKVEFPIDDLDISNYVINEELPMDYPIERIIPNFNVQDPSTMATEETNINGTISGSQEESKMNIESEENKTPKSPARGEKLKTQMHLEGDATAARPGLNYSLFGVVNHYGNLGFGHYTAYAKNHKRGDWYHFDDSRVSEENPENVCTPAAYVLFYKRKDWEFKI